ncbi:hypothetical protein ACA910_011130 [Epithemia clementina (nom. ined.)]
MAQPNNDNGNQPQPVENAMMSRASLVYGSSKPVPAIISRAGGGAMAGAGSSTYEAFLGLVCGAVFGAVSPLVGHPLDSIKTRMQAEPAFRGTTVGQTVQLIYQREGLRGFYRGFVPPLVGSMAFRAVLFSTYSGTYAACAQIPILEQPLPCTGGLRPSVVLGAMAAAVARASVESPFDYIKVRSMLGQSIILTDTAATTTATTSTTVPVKTWKVPPSSAVLLFYQSMTTAPVATIGQLYRGFGATLWRTMGLLGSFFILVDYSVRYIPEVVTTPVVGPFFKGGICATLGWAVAFPFETAKSVIQSDSHSIIHGNSNKPQQQPQQDTFRVLYRLYKERGIVRGWYRGFGPGASRSFVANGASMIVYSWLQDYIRT